MDCIFCKIVAGEIPSHKVYQDDNVFAFLDIAPVNPGHTLVIPKKHFVNMEEIPEDELVKLIKVVKKIGKAIKRELAVSGYNVQINNDPVAGQLVPHLHFHIMPRNENDGLKLWPQDKYQEGEAEQAAKKIKTNL